MRSHASAIERLLVRSLPLAVVLGLLSATLFGLVAQQRQVAHADGPMITIVSPSSASGPVQTGIEVTGSGWNAGSLPQDKVQVYYSAPSNNMPCGDPNSSQTTAQTNQIPGFSVLSIGSSTTWTIDFQWPATAIGPFYVCAFDTTTPTVVTASTQPFTVLSTAPPGITISSTTPNIGDQVTVTGTGFLPGNQPIDLFLAQPGQQTGASLGTATAANDGSFTQMVTLPTAPSGQLNIIALARASVNGALAPLSASVPVTVGASPSTPTPPAAGTVTPVTTPTVTTPTTTNSSSSGLILVALIVALVLVILAIFGVLFWYVAGTRPPAGVAAPAGPPPGPPPGRARAPVAPRGGASGRQSQQGWQADDDWDNQVGPWEEDDQGGWNDLPTQWGDEGNAWPQNPRGQSGPGTPPPRSGPAGRGNAGVQRPAPPRGPNRDDWPGNPRSGQDGW